MNAETLAQMDAAKEILVNRHANGDIPKTVTAFSANGYRPVPLNHIQTAAAVIEGLAAAREAGMFK